MPTLKEKIERIAQGSPVVKGLNAQAQVSIAIVEEIQGDNFIKVSYVDPNGRSVERSFVPIYQYDNMPPPKPKIGSICLLVFAANDHKHPFAITSLTPLEDRLSPAHSSSSLAGTL